MTFRRKYIEPILIYLAVYLASYLLCQVGEMLFTYAYTYLSEVTPNLVDTVNPIYTPDEYKLYLRCTSLSGVVVGIWLINYLALRFDNKKFEHVISKTEGKYTMREGLRLYYSEFVITDLIASTVVISAFVLGAYFIPEKWLDYGLVFLFKPGMELTSYCHPVLAVILVSAISFTTRLISVPPVVRKWRALWLSGSV